jgi:carboxypeptidase PM20D1
MKKFLFLILLLVGILIAVVVVKTITHPFATLADNQQVPVKVPISEMVVRRFANGLTYQTISYIDSVENNFAVYDSFLVYLNEQYPRVFERLEKTVINKYQIVLRWKGSNESLKPILFMSHYDVVHPGPHDYEHDDEYSGQNMFDLHDEELPLPMEEFTNWEQPPFGGVVKNGRIYGRGAIDMKSVLFALLESVDALLAQGTTPERDIYIALNPDEEVGGLRGAAKMAEYFKDKGMQFEAIFDEGGIIATPGTAEGINQNLAFIGVAEKGVVAYRIKVKGTGGHSSMPPLQTAAGKAAVIMQRLETNQMPQRIIGPMQNFLNIAGAGMGFTGRMAIANQWLFEGILLKKMAKIPQTNALTRTTTAITMLKGSDGNNVLPQKVEIVVNFRILPGETSVDVLNHIKKACEGFEVEIDAARIPVEPSNLSPTEGKPYELILAGIEKLYPGTLVTPYLTLGATDCKHMGELSNNIYRFMPVLLNPIEQRTIHNFNEYMSVENYARMIAYYTHLMQNFDAR